MSDYRDAVDEHLGIASGFLFAGSLSVLSTQWAVDERPAVLLIAAYYANLGRTDPASALAAAQRELRNASRRDLARLLDRVDELDAARVLDERSHATLQEARQSVRQRRPDYSHPVFWAAYTVTGLDGPA
ncbi:CHAT domain-containing protein [Intrasporangium mesophilum]